ncbi:porin [Vibrio sp. PID17_43]|uniref:porin n=1 Tax=unclassified Vibrio TaxID=2614977 RepID=UPI000BFFD917|nr:porin [Vibrio sp. PID17_43]PHJ41983.1 hypothetical protein AK965_08660 [Vibrio sp. PID17_43]
MDKMFKRTLLGAAVAAAGFAGTANAAIPLAGDAVQFYGQAAGFMTYVDPAKGDGSVATTIESRIGFRGVVEFEDFGPNFIWQIEGGNANNGGFDPNQSWTHTDNGQLGARDTYLGFDFDGVGSFKWGRQLVAAYNYVDWPHSNPGLGNVFDWNNDIGAGYEDRANNVLRFDSANFNGFNFQATLSGMGSSTEQIVSNIAGSYSQEMFSVHAGYYTQKGYNVDVAATDPTWGQDKDGEWAEQPGEAAYVKKAGDISYYVVGGSVFLDNLTLTAAMKGMENNAYDGKAVKAKQNAYSATAQYVLDGQWVFKAGYASTDEAKADGKTLRDKYGNKTNDLAVTARLGYLLPSTYLYLDSRNYKMNDSDKWTNGVLAGVEYYF